MEVVSPSKQPPARENTKHNFGDTGQHKPKTKKAKNEGSQMQFSSQVSPRGSLNNIGGGAVNEADLKSEQLLIPNSQLHNNQQI